MSGALGLLLGSGRVNHFRVTVGNSGGTVFGFVSGIIGAVLPGTRRDSAGATVRNIRQIATADNGDATFTLTLQLDGTPSDADSVFSELSVGGGVYSRASSASSTPVAGVRQWAWITSNVLGTSGTKTVGIR